MGHTTLTVTNHYASLTSEYLRKPHERYYPLKNDDKPSIDETFGTGYWNE